MEKKTKENEKRENIIQNEKYHAVWTIERELKADELNQSFSLIFMYGLINEWQFIE